MNHRLQLLKEQLRIEAEERKERLGMEEEVQKEKLRVEAEKNYGWRKKPARSK